MPAATVAQLDRATAGGHSASAPRQIWLWKAVAAAVVETRRRQTRFGDWIFVRFGFLFILL